MKVEVLLMNERNSDGPILHYEENFGIFSDWGDHMVMENNFKNKDWYYFFEKSDVDDLFPKREPY